jgi:hypothetical protein
MAKANTSSPTRDRDSIRFKSRLFPVSPMAQLVLATPADIVPYSSPSLESNSTQKCNKMCGQILLGDRRRV